MPGEQAYSADGEEDSAGHGAKSDLAHLIFRLDPFDFYKSLPNAARMGTATWAVTVLLDSHSENYIPEAPAELIWNSHKAKVVKVKGIRPTLMPAVKVN